jgi:predicted permease
LGIAASTAVFGWIYTILLHPFPGVEQADRLAAIETVLPSGEFSVSSFRDYRDYRDHNSFAAGMSASLLNAFNLGDDQRPSRVWGEYVTSNYFAVLGMGAVRGRTFAPTDFGDSMGANPYVVISHRLWQKQFNSDQHIIGREVRLNRNAMKVLGVAPPGFYGTVPGLALDLWVPVIMAPELNGQGEWLLTDRNQRQFWITTRLKPGATTESATAEIRSLARRIAEGSPRTNMGFSAQVLPVWKAHFGAQGLLLKPLQVLMAICAVMFLIVAANVTNIQLARATAREKEFGIRLAMGAGRGRLLRQLLIESLMLAMAGAAGGVLISVWLAQSLSWLMPPVNLPVAFEFALNYKILAFTGALCIVAAVLTGIAPALHAARANLNETLKDAATTSTGSRVHRTRELLVVGEIAWRWWRWLAPGFL